MLCEKGGPISPWTIDFGEITGVAGDTKTLVQKSLVRFQASTIWATDDSPGSAGTGTMLRYIFLGQKVQYQASREPVLLKAQIPSDRGAWWMFDLAEPGLDFSVSVKFFATCTFRIKLCGHRVGPGFVNPLPSTAIPMILYCPICHARHVDEGDYSTKEHHTHACQNCGNCWRPAIVPTVGVQFLPGFKNDPVSFAKHIMGCPARTISDAKCSCDAVRAGLANGSRIFNEAFPKRQSARIGHWTPIDGSEEHDDLWVVKVTETTVYVETIRKKLGEADRDWFERNYVFVQDHDG